MSSFSADAVNSGFVENIGTRDGMAKAADAAGSYIKDRLREASFTDMIIPNQRVVRGDLQRSTEHDTLVKIVDIEPGSRAMPLNFRGQPTATYINGKRFAISFYTIASQKFEITEQELAAYEMPITKILETNSLKDMVEVKDREFLLHAEACIDAMQEEGNGGAVAYNATNVNAGTVVGVSKVKGALALAASADDFTPRAIQPADIVNIKKLLMREVSDSSGETIRGGRLRPSIALITDSDMTDFDQWTVEDNGASLQSEIAKDGWSFNKARGLKFVKTIKNDILREGNVYVFTEAEFLGRNYTYNDVKFYIDKQFNKIFWAAWMDVGMGIGNIASIVKLELYSGAVTDGAEDSGYAAAEPKELEQLGKENNKVGEGLTFPSLNVF
jgi:hypothetical protein